MPLLRLLPALLLAGALPAGAAAQTLRGRVLDRTDESPVGGAALHLIGPDSQQVASALADDQGYFAVTAPAQGEYMVAVERIGYAPARLGPFRLRANGFAAATLALTPQPVALDSVGVRIENQDPALRARGFYQRRQDSHGVFLEAAEIQQRSTTRMADVLSGLNGVRVVGDNGMTDVQLRGNMMNVFRPGGPQICFPTIYLDGLAVADGKMAGFGRMNLETIRPTDVAGLEIYMGESSVPLQFARGGGACGAILFWTRIR